MDGVRGTVSVTKRYTERAKGELKIGVADAQSRRDANRECSKPEPRGAGAGPRP
jgi:hypothetical protein